MFVVVYLYSGNDMASWFCQIAHALHESKQLGTDSGQGT